MVLIVNMEIEQLRYPILYLRYRWQNTMYQMIGSKKLGEKVFTVSQSC